MTDAASPNPPSFRVHRWLWLWGGVLFVASVLASLLGTLLVGPWVEDALLLAGILLFTLGRDSVTARRPLGTITLIAFGVWPLVINSIVFSAQYVGSSDPLAVATTLVLYASPYLHAALGLIGTVQIARAGVVRGGWRWVPLVGLAIAAGWYVVMILLAYAPASADVLVALWHVGTLVACLGVGIVGIALSTVPRERVEPPAVPVYPAGP